MLDSQILLTLISINISQLKNYTKAWDFTSFLPPLPSLAEHKQMNLVAQSTSPSYWDLLREVCLSYTLTAVT